MTMGDAAEKQEFSRERVFGSGLGLVTKEPALAQETPHRMTLREVRKDLGRTQVQVADQAGMSQGDLSRLERRNDHLLSTLQRYAAALGGRLEVTVVREDKRYPLEF